MVPCVKNELNLPQRQLIVSDFHRRNSSMLLYWTETEDHAHYVD
jgi:hypothetical protein